MFPSAYWVQQNLDQHCRSPSSTYIKPLKLRVIGIYVLLNVGLLTVAYFVAISKHFKSYEYHIKDNPIIKICCDGTYIVDWTVEELSMGCTFKMVQEYKFTLNGDRNVENLCIRHHVYC